MLWRWRRRVRPRNAESRRAEPRKGPVDAGQHPQPDPYGARLAILDTLRAGLTRFSNLAIVQRLTTCPRLTHGEVMSSPTERPYYWLFAALAVLGLSVDLASKYVVFSKLYPENDFQANVS